MTLEILVSRFINEQRRSGKSVLTLSAYATDLKQFSSLLPSPALPLSAEKIKMVCQKWTAGFSPNAAARKLTTLRSFLSWGYEKGYIKKDLAAGVGRPKRETVTAAKPLSPSQVARLRRTATVKERLLLELLLNTGMKLSDAVNLKMKSLGAIRHSEAAGTYNSARGGMLRSAGRRIPEKRDPSSAFGGLRMTGGRIPISDYLRQTLEYYLAAVSRGPRSYLLVSGRTGRPYSPRMAAMILNKLGKRAGVKGVTPRNLRATLRKK